MAVDNKQIATDVLELVGGAENVTVATNCMTRLRLTLKDNNKADVEKIKKVKGVLGCQFAGSQLQVIIGQNVPKVLAEFVAMSGVKQGAAVDENLDAPKEKFELKNLPNIILDYLSGSMTQLIPLLMAGGLFRTIAAVLGPTMLGVLSDTDPTYTFLYTTLYEATFTFIPIYLGYAAAKKLGAPPGSGHAPRRRPHGPVRRECRDPGWRRNHLRLRHSDRRCQLSAVRPADYPFGACPLLRREVL